MIGKYAAFSPPYNHNINVKETAQSQELTAEKNKIKNILVLERCNYELTLID